MVKMVAVILGAIAGFMWLFDKSRVQMVVGSVEKLYKVLIRAQFWRGAQVEKRSY